MNGRLYDPINVFCSIALVSLHEPGTRLDLHNNTVAIQPPAASQAFARFFGKSSRGDMYTLLYPMRRFIELTCLNREILAYRTPVNTPRTDKLLPPPPTLDLNSHDDDDITNSDSLPERSCSIQKVPSKSSNKSSKYVVPSSSPPSFRVSSLPTAQVGVLSSSSTTQSNVPSPALVTAPEVIPTPLVNHLYRNHALHKLLRYYQAGIRALQKTYNEDNAEVALQQAYNVVGDAFELADSGGDVSRSFRLLPPSCASYNSSIIDQSAVIKLWADDTLQSILELLEAYMKEPLPQNLLTCRAAVSELLSKKNDAYQVLITMGSK
jgi:hypothetical protein